MEPAAKRARSSSPEPDGYETFKIDRFPTYHTDVNGKKITYLTTVWTDWPIGPNKSAKIVGTVMTAHDDVEDLEGGVMVDFNGIACQMYVKLHKLRVASDEEEADPNFAWNTGRSKFWPATLRVVQLRGSNVKPGKIRLGNLVYKAPLRDAWSVFFDDYIENTVPTDDLVPLHEFKTLK